MTPPQSPQSWVDSGDTDCLFYRCPRFFTTILGGFRWYRPFYRWPHHSHYNLGWIQVIRTVCSIAVPAFSLQSWVDSGDTDCLFYRCPRFFTTPLGGFRWNRLSVLSMSPLFHYNLGWIQVIQTVCSIYAPAFSLQSWMDSGNTDRSIDDPTTVTTILGGFRWYRLSVPSMSPLFHYLFGWIQVIQTVCSIDAPAFSLQSWEFSTVCSINDSAHSPQLWPVATTNTYRNPHVNLARCFTVSHDLGQTQAEVGFPSYWEAFLVSHSDRRLTCFFTSEILSEWRINSNKSVK